MKQFKDSEPKAAERQVWISCFLNIALCLALGEILAMMFAWENSFSTGIALPVSVRRILYMPKYLERNLFSAGGIETVLALGLTGRNRCSCMEAGRKLLSSNVSQDGIWSYRAVWIEGLIFCLTILSVVAWKSLKSAKAEITEERIFSSFTLDRVLEISVKRATILGFCPLLFRVGVLKLERIIGWADSLLKKLFMPIDGGFRRQNVMNTKPSQGL